MKMLALRVHGLRILGRSNLSKLSRDFSDAKIRQALLRLSGVDSGALESNYFVLVQPYHHKNSNIFHARKGTLKNGGTASICHKKADDIIMLQLLSSETKGDTAPHGTKSLLGR